MTPRERLLIVGKTGMGKSHRAKQLIREWGSRGVRVVVLDVGNEYGPAAGGPCRETCTAAELAAHPEKLTQARLSLAVTARKTSASAARAAAFLLQAARATGKPCVLVLDEVGLWADQAAGPECHKARVALEHAATTGRADGLALCLLTQRAAQVPPNARSQVSSIIAFRQDEPADLAALAERGGKDFSVSVSALGEWECVEWADSTNRRQKPAQKGN